MIYLVVVFAYLACAFAIGLYKMRKVKTQEDFMVAGRNTHWLLLVGTLICTWIGSGSLFGGAGLAFRMGFSELWMSAGAWVGIAIVYFLAPRVRRIAEFTVSDILEKRYNQWARLLGSVSIIIAYLTIAGYQFRGGGRLLHILTGLDPTIGGLITCIVTILFTASAGLVSIISIDIINGIIMMLGVLVGVPLALHAVGGWSQVAQNLPADHFTTFGSNDWVWAAGVFFPTFFLLMGEGSMYQKFFSAKNENTARKAVIGMIVGVIFLETMLCTLAVIGSSKYFNLAPFSEGGVMNKAVTETIILHLARFDLPPLAGALLIAAGVAIILSTANTFLMTPSTSIARDLYQRFINPSAGDRQIVRLQRILIVVLGLLAYILASFFKSILDMAFTAYTFVGAGVTPALLAAFLWRRATPVAGAASVGMGMIVTLLITIANVAMEGTAASVRLFGIHLLPMETDYIIIPAALASILTLIIVSWLTPPPAEAKWRPFWNN